MDRNSKVSLCFVFQDNTNEVVRLLNSLMVIDIHYCGEIIAVDNFSSDCVAINLIQGLKDLQKFKDIKIITIRNSKRESLPHNRNLCYKNSSCELILFVDSDIEFIQDNFFEALINNFSNYKCDLMAPVIYGKLGEIQSIGLKKLFGLPYIFKFRRELGKGNFPVDMIHGACFASRSEVFHLIGGFDEFMMPYNFDEMDFAIRAKINGFSITAFDNIFIRHYGGGTTSRFKQTEKAYYFVRHAIRSIRRNYSSIVGALIIALFISAVSVMLISQMRTYLGSNIIAKSIIWNLKNSYKEEQK